MKLLNNTNTSAFQSDLLSRVTCGNLSGLLHLAESHATEVADEGFIVPASSGHVYALPFLHLIVLNACLNEQHSSLSVSIINSLHTKDGKEARGHRYGLETMALWEPSQSSIVEMSALHLAAWYNTYDMVSTLVSLGSHVNLQNIKGLTPLHMSTSGQGPQTQVIRYLLEMKANPNIGDVDGSTSLHKAIGEGCGQEVIELLIKQGQADVNAERRVGLRTPLIQTSANDDMAIPHVLLEAGAKLEYATPRRKTVLHYAVSSHSQAMVELILNSGGSFLSNFPDNMGLTPFMIAVRDVQLEMVEEFTKRGEPRLDFTNIMGVTVWDIAMDASNEEILKLLIAKHSMSLVGKSLGDRMVPVCQISPLQVATKRDKVEDIHMLLQFGISPEERDTLMLNTFLHTAAAGNHHHILEEPWNGYKHMLLAQNTNQDTPFHIAMRQGDSKTLDVLFRKAEANALPSVLHTLNQQKYCPLHVCCNRADKGIAEVTGYHVGKILQQMPQLALKEYTDAQGNSYLHLAARNNLSSFCHKLLTLNINGNLRNDIGNTPLHEAVISGHMDTVRLLLNTTPQDQGGMSQHRMDVCDLNLRNKKGRTILHCSSLSPNVTPQLLTIVIESMQTVATGGTALLDETDEIGNTALHLLMGRDDLDNPYPLIKAMTICNFCIVNGTCDTPLHIAAKNANPRMLEAALQVLNEKKSPTPLNIENCNGKTILMLSIQSGHTEVLEQLIKEGSNLAYKSGTNGDTVLHHLVRLSVQQPGYMGRWTTMYSIICQLGVKWWCQSNDIVEPKPASKYHSQIKCLVVKYLTSAVRNGDAGVIRYPSLGLSPSNDVIDPLQPEEGPGHTVLQLTSLVGAAPMLEVILNTPGIYCMSRQEGERRTSKYDVTYLTPDSSYHGDKKMAVSCFEYLSLAPDRLVVPFLSTTPLQDLARNYWKRYQWIFVILMIIHIIYMAVFCYFGLKLHYVPKEDMACVAAPPIAGSPHLYNMSGVCSFIEVPSVPFPGLHSLLLIWPLIIASYQLWYIITRCRRHIRALVLVDEWNVSTMVTAGGLSYGWRLFYKEITNIASIVFGLFVVLWYIFLGFRSIIEVYFLSLSFGVGWLLTITYARGFETVNSFSIMIKYIIIKDITKFMFFFVFIFLGFSFAQHALFLHSLAYVLEHPTLLYTFFYVFQMMISIADPFAAAYDHDLRNAGIDVAFPKIIYVIFMIINAIILLNILIAMITDSYVNLKSKEVAQWRLANLKLAIDLEKNLSRLKYILRASDRGRRNVYKETTVLQPRSKYGNLLNINSERYYFTLPEHNTS